MDPILKLFLLLNIKSYTSFKKMATAVLKLKSEDSPGNELGTDFEKIVEECMKNNRDWGLLQNDILFAATYWLMMECGFTAVARTNEKTKNVEEETTLPDSWKHGTKQLYEGQFILPPYDEHLVRLVALPADDILCINISVSNVSPRNFSLKSLAVSSSGFVPRPEANHVSSKFSDLNYFRFYMRSTLIWPIRCSILTDEGIVNGSLMGLSDEIKLKIIYFLDTRDVLALGETCHDLNRISNDQGFWKTIFHKHFKAYCKCGGKSKECDESSVHWKENYKHYYKLKSANKNSRHSSMESFHTAPDNAYYEVDLSYD